MADIILTATIFRRLFLPDVVPWFNLQPESNREKLRLRYKLSQLTQQTDPTTGGFARLLSPAGEFPVGDTLLLLEQLIIEPLAVQFQLNGDSDIADKFMIDLSNFFLEIDPDKKFSNDRQLTTTYQTIAVVRFPFPYTALFSKSFSQCLDALALDLKAPDADVEIRLQSIRWNVSYKLHTADYTYLPKQLVIEPRAGSRPEDMVFFTQSPTDFKTHKKLIESLERSILLDAASVK